MILSPLNSWKKLELITEYGSDWIDWHCTKKAGIYNYKMFRDLFIKHCNISILD